MRSLNYQLKQLCKTNRDGSYSTQSNRHKTLQKLANDLHTLGYRGMESRSLKQKHVQALVNHYQSEKLAIGTLKNRMAVLRWWANKLGRPQVVASTNEYYGIGTRQLVAKESKAKTLESEKHNQITCRYIKMSLKLQAVFGLRREESIKFQPHYADQQAHIQLKSTWCKGGRARVVPIRTAEQRDVLNRAHQLAGSGSLIPAGLSYAQQMRKYEKQCLKAGLSKMHGLRHDYAQQRYTELTGWLAPVCGGPASRQLTPQQKQQDLKARLTISAELGHRREQITASYLGR